MSTHKHFNKICYAVLAVTLAITILFMNGKSLGIPVMASEDENNAMFTTDDLNSDWNTSNATEIILSDNGCTVNGNGAYTHDGNIYIAYAGQYIISGALSDGSIIINADKNDKIWLLFNNVSIHCNDNAAVLIEQADKVFLTLADKTENTLTTGSAYNSDAVSSGIDGTIYSRDDLTINGNGTLNITAEYNHGIVCNDDLVISGGTITTNAVQDAIHANDSVRIKDADIKITAGDDGITVSNDNESAYLYIESGKINIESCYEGLEAIDITIADGTIDITATDDGINASGSGENSAINIKGGNITITNANGRDADGLDSNKDIYISGGNLLISVANDGSSSAIDYGTENGGVCKISGGTVLACGSSGMAEGFDSSSTQGFIMYNISANAGTTVTLENSEGAELLSEKIPCSFSSVVVSTPEMHLGDTCILTVGETKEEITIDNSTTSPNFGQGGMPGGKMMGRDMQDSNSKQVFSNQEGMENMISDNAMPLAVSVNQNENPPAMPASPDGQNFDNAPNGNQMEKPNGESFGDGMQPPEIPNNANPDGIQPNGENSENGMQPPGIPNNANSDGTQPNGENSENGMQPPEIPNNADSDSTQPNFSQDTDQFGGQQNEQSNDKANKNTPNSMKEANSSDTQKNALTKENIIYLSVSFGVLIIGCIIAFLFKKRR